MQFNKILLGYVGFETVSEVENTPVIIIPNVWKEIKSAYTRLMSQSGNVYDYIIIKDRIRRLLTTTNANAIWLVDHIYTDSNPPVASLKHCWMEFPPLQAESTQFQYARWEDNPEVYFNFLDELPHILDIFNKYVLMFDINGNKTQSLTAAYMTVNYNLMLWNDAADFKQLFGFKYAGTRFEVRAQTNSRDYPNMTIAMYGYVNLTQLFCDLGYTPFELSEDYNFEALYPGFASRIVAEVSTQFVQR